eukprot:TRINITY_DN19681_c0_g3_i1.p1 TRINITY_DN19681_c0_g3~~TRINITY_DN19681_c0_g3_i1.p1  ORF type:complete len:463 (+),score=62.91 TRINITY_DN19681_c0_g3_i1:53-1390(+)
MGKRRGSFQRRILQEWIHASLLLAVSFSMRSDLLMSEHLKGRGPPCMYVVNGVPRWHLHASWEDRVAEGKRCKCRRHDHKVFCGDRMVSERRYDVAGASSIIKLAVCQRLPVGQFPECRLPPGVLPETGLKSCSTTVKNLVLGPPAERAVVDVSAPFEWSQFGCDEAAQPYKSMLKELVRHEKALGGLKNFASFEDIRPIKGSAQGAQLSFPPLTHYEYVALQIIGFACAAANAKDISDLNNGQAFKYNLGTQLLNKRCGIVWHGTDGNSDRLLTLAGELLVDAFEASDDPELFFRTAFSSSSDPCLEGRIRVLEGYLMSKHSESGSGGPSLEDVVVRNLGQSATNVEKVGEYLRVFRNECVWRWAQEREAPLSFQEANHALNSPQLTSEDESSFERLFNAGEFRSYLERLLPRASEASMSAVIKKNVDFYVENLALPPAPVVSS